MNVFALSLCVCVSILQEGVFPMTQNRALQLLFDLRYLNTVLGSKMEDSKSSRSHQDPR